MLQAFGSVNIQSSTSMYHYECAALCEAISSLDWVLSRWAHFTVVESCVYVFFALYCLTAYVLYYCNTAGGVDPVRLKPNL